MIRTHAWARDWMLIAIALLWAGISGCSGQSAPERLVGRWKGEIELQEAVVKQELQQAANDPAQLAVLTKRYKDMQEMTMNVEFNANGEMSISAEVGPITQSTRGRWQITAKEGNMVKVNSIEGEGLQQELRITFLDDDSFTTPPPGPNKKVGLMRFHRLK